MCFAHFSVTPNCTVEWINGLCPPTLFEEDWGRVEHGKGGVRRKFTTALGDSYSCMPCLFTPLRIHQKRSLSIFDLLFSPNFHIDIVYSMLDKVKTSCRLILKVEETPFINCYFI